MLIISKKFKYAVMTDFFFNYEMFPHTKARIGKLTTPHGTIETPAFIFCATKAAIKGVTPKQLRDAETQIILSNTYHLMLQPGGEIVNQLGGLQKMTGWHGPMLTDSGGFQIFSLGHSSVSAEIKGKHFSKHPKTMLKITEEGAKFKSYIDGRLHLLTPEKAIQTQVNLGADLIVVLDECTPFHVDKSYTRES
jgi:queuine tRNA-ribosyltransferase